MVLCMVVQMVVINVYIHLELLSQLKTYCFSWYKHYLWTRCMTPKKKTIIKIESRD